MDIFMIVKIVFTGWDGNAIYGKEEVKKVTATLAIWEVYPVTFFFCTVNDVREKERTYWTNEITYCSYYTSD